MGFPLFNSRGKKKKNPEKSHFLSVKSCVSSSVNCTLAEKNAFRETFQRDCAQALELAFENGGKTHKAINYSVDSSWLCPFFIHQAYSYTPVSLWNTFNSLKKNLIKNDNFPTVTEFSKFIQ